MTDVLRLTRREPYKAYIDNMLWLPKRDVRWQAIVEALEFWDVEDGAPVRVRLWQDSPNHIGVPREFLKVSDYSSYPFPFVDLTPKSFPKSGLVSRIKSWRTDKQSEADQALNQALGGILNLGCGKGKTVLFLNHAARLGCPALVVVHNSYLMQQWIERIEEHIQLPPGEKIGIIQGPDFDWQRPIAIAMINTLALRAKEGNIPVGFEKHFGVVGFDEVHHLAAPFFCHTAPLVHGQRYGLTATPTRLDGREFIYYYHLGPVFYSDTEQDLIPQTYFQLTPSKLDMDSGDVKDVKGEFNISKARSALGRDPNATYFRYRCIKEAADAGRKILAVSHSKDQLIELHKMLPGSGLIIQETDKTQRGKIVKNSRISLSIVKLGIEGLDDPMLDTLFCLTPFSSPNDLEQVYGRIGSRDPNAVKNHPIAIIFDDVHIKPFHAMCQQLKKKLNEWAYPFQIFSAPTFQ